MKKRILVLLLITVMLIGAFCGCGGDSGKSNNSSTDSTVTLTQEEQFNYNTILRLLPNSAENYNLFKKVFSIIYAMPAEYETESGTVKRIDPYYGGHYIQSVKSPDNYTVDFQEGKNVLCGKFKDSPNQLIYYRNYSGSLISKGIYSNAIYLAFGTNVKKDLIIADLQTFLDSCTGVQSDEGKVQKYTATKNGITYIMTTYFESGSLDKYSSYSIEILK